VTTEPGIDTSQFIEATEGVIKLFDLLGSSAFLIVQNDMKGNVKVSRDACVVNLSKEDATLSLPPLTTNQKIQDRLLSNPALNGTLQDLVKNEGAPGDKKRVATEGLMWLLR
jgi:hypothetical protein